MPQPLGRRQIPLTPSHRKHPEWLDSEANTGDDMAGVIHEVGNGVSEFKKGERVACFHVMRTPGGSFAEYGVGPSNTTFRLPPETTFEGL